MPSGNKPLSELINVDPDLCAYGITRQKWVNTLRPRQNGHHFADDIFKCIFLNESIWISIEISLKFVPKGPINNIPALVQIMATGRRRPGDKPLSEPMLVCLLTHICVTRPQWVKHIWLWLHPGHFITYISSDTLWSKLKLKVLENQTLCGVNWKEKSLWIC